MISIYLDSSQKENKLYLIDGKEITTRHSFLADNNSDSQLLTEFDNFLKTNKLTLRDINKLIVNLGPGSFTGTRNGITLANGFKLARPNIDLISLSNPTDPDIIAGLDNQPLDILLPIYSSSPSITKPKIK